MNARNVACVNRILSVLAKQGLGDLCQDILLLGFLKSVQLRDFCLFMLYLLYSRTTLFRIGLALPVNLPRILQNYLPLKLPVIGSSTVQYSTAQYSVMAYRTANKAWSKCLDAGTYCNQ